jgi:hypothetical protein
MVATICTAPKGMLKSMVSNLPKPKDLMMSGPKVDIPPLGMLELGQFCVFYIDNWT